MADQDQLLEKASDFARTVLTTRSPDWAVYHSYEHTLETVEAAREIAEGSKLDRTETEIVLLAAWLHDLGYTETVDGHEERSVAMARQFLSANGYTADRTERVVECIMATKVPQNPANLLQQVICDADMAHLGRKRFFEKNDLIRLEMERRSGKPMSDREWLTLCTDFVASQRFHTAYAREEFQARKTRNLLGLQEMLREAVAGDAKRMDKKEKQQELVRNKLDKASRPDRGIETMFRVVPKNHLDLTAMADSKAHMMINTNSVIISVVGGLLFKDVYAYPHLLVPMIILVTCSLTAIVFAVLATRPKITQGRFTKEDISAKRANLLFFGNFHRMSLEDFEWGMNEMMKDRDYLYGNMIRDLHTLGRILAVKYRYLRISFNVFMYGLVLAMIAFIIAVLTVPTGAS